MEISADQGRRAFAHWLRTGRLPAVRTADGIELKFNPYHDPQNGRFTFGPGGTAGTTKPSSRRFGQHASLVASEAQREPARGSNSRAFEIPMTLEQSFPGLRNSPGGALIAVADNLFDFTGPANESMAQFLQDQSRQLTSQINAIDPNWHYDEMGPTDAFGKPIVTI